MNLTEKEYAEFIEIQTDLLVFVGKQKNYIFQHINNNDFLDLDIKVKLNCRNALLENDELIDSYILSNIENLTTEKINVLKGFKRKISGDFIILKCLSKHAVFINSNSNQFYMVGALIHTFDCFFDRFPVLVKTVLLPYKDKITYDGFLQSYKISFGPGYKSTFNEDYKEAKKNNEIIKLL